MDKTSKARVGHVLSVADAIVQADGLEEVGSGELVYIYTTDYQKIPGIALDLNEGSVGIVATGHYSAIKQGDIVETTGFLPKVTVSEGLLGRVVNALGEPVDGLGEIVHKNDNDSDNKSKDMLLDRIAPGVMSRRDVYRPIQTGILAIDAMIPIGRGQRELIIGDKQTGKTAIAIDTIINQRDKDCYCIYVAIGQKQSKIAQLMNKLIEQGALANTIIVSAPASESVALQYLAAYTGTAIGEYFAEKGKDALVVYDDLSKHAQAYREIALLLNRPSGREAYPGDIFYLHSKVLERAVQYSDANGGGSLTALPIVETQAGDVSAYIPTNIISITDGQIFLEQGLFNAGQRPAISVGISVSRVGGAAQTKGMKQVAGQMKLDLAQYRELASFAQFGSDLDVETKEKLDRGARVMQVIKQRQYSPYTIPEMMAITFAATNNLLKEIPLDRIEQWLLTFTKLIRSSEIAGKLKGDSKIEAELLTELTNIIQQFNKDFHRTYA
jgi:F-type H+-transporting ATPase subunit alpha